MEKNKLTVFLDVKNQLAFLYTEDSVKKISFHDVNSLNKYLSDKNISYVTNVMKTNGDVVIDTIKKVTKKIKGKPVEQFIEQKSEEMFLKSNSGSILISDLKLEIKSNEFYSLKTLESKYGVGILEKHGFLRKLLDNKKIILITNSEKIEMSKNEVKKTEGLKVTDLRSATNDKEDEVKEVAGHEVIELDLSNPFSSGGAKKIGKGSTGVSLPNESGLTIEE